MYEQLDEPENSWMAVCHVTKQMNDNPKYVTSIPSSKWNPIHGPRHMRSEGAKIFVWPHQYTAVIEALKSKVRCKDIELHASSVIISQSLVPSLEASISTILSNKNVRPNREGIACVANEEKTYLITEKRCIGGLITESDGLEDWNPYDDWISSILVGTRELPSSLASGQRRSLGLTQKPKRRSKYTERRSKHTEECGPRHDVTDLMPPVIAGLADTIYMLRRDIGTQESASSS